MAPSLSNPFDNLTERIHKIKRKDWYCFFEYESVKDNLISCNEDHSNKIDEELKKRFKNTLKFCSDEKVFIFMSTWMIGNNLAKQHYR